MQPDRPAPFACARSRLFASAVVAGIAALLYRRTLMPGFDLGDTASFQTLVGSSVLTPRDAYPLYFAFGKLFVALSGGGAEGPAFALNLVSAFFGAVAAGLVCWVSARLSGSILAGMVAGLMLAGSYTFWSQAVIAEVYTLHVTLVLGSIAAFLWWADLPSERRLALALGIYLASFGNHLSMILLAPGILLFLIMNARRGSTALFTQRTVFLGLTLAIVAAVQYAWTVYGLWVTADRPISLTETARIFWFDATKSDWRESLVGGVHPTRVLERVEMSWFDLRQQFGLAGILLAITGAIRLLAIDRAAATMILVSALVSFAFAFGYNVGDSHVFFLPTHTLIAVLMAPAVSWLRSFTQPFTRGISLVRPPARMRTVILSAAVMAWPIYRIADTYPALDRSADRRPAALLDQITTGMRDDHRILGTHLDWETQNGLSYYAKFDRPELTWFRLIEVLPHLPFLVDSNAVAGRSITLTPAAADLVRASYGDLFEIHEDPTVHVPALSERAGSIAPGEAYVLAVIEPAAGRAIDPDDLDRLATRLGTASMPTGRYSVMAGVAGRSPALRQASDRPFRRTLDVGTLTVDIRIECWLPFDTIRRAGFGHVIVNRRHALTIERGISLVAVDGAGRARLIEYEAGLFAPQKRYQIQPGSGIRPGLSTPSGSNRLFISANHGQRSP